MLKRTPASTRGPTHHFSGAAWSFLATAGRRRMRMRLGGLHKHPCGSLSTPTAWTAPTQVRLGVDPHVCWCCCGPGDSGVVVAATWRFHAAKCCFDFVCLDAQTLTSLPPHTIPTTYTHHTTHTCTVSIASYSSHKTIPNIMSLHPRQFKPITPHHSPPLRFRHPSALSSICRNYKAPCRT